MTKITVTDNRDTIIDGITSCKELLIKKKKGTLAVKPIPALHKLRTDRISYESLLGKSITRSAMTPVG